MHASASASLAPRAIGHRPAHSSVQTLLLATALLFAPIAMAGPPLLCHPFDTAGARSLPWGSAGWNNARSDYALTRLAADTQALITRQTPVIVRMETLRRAAIYASRDRNALRALSTALEARVVAAGKSGTANDEALALFDAGYFSETLQDIARLQGYDMPGIGRIDAAAVRAALARGEGSVRIAQALKLRPNDAAMRFAAALVSSADQRQADYATHARIARAGARGDRLLARNIAQITN